MNFVVLLWEMQYKTLSALWIATEKNGSKQERGKV